MKVLADENCEREMIDRLRALGHDVVTIADIAPSIDDASIFQFAAREERVLLTNDQDFGVIAEHATSRPPAVALMRLDRVNPPLRIDLVLRALTELDDGLKKNSSL